MRTLNLIRRIKPLDAATMLVLVVAVYFFVRPGSAVHSSTTQWLAQRHLNSSAKQNWSKLTKVANRLYDGTAEPQIVEISDYECPFCRQSSAAVDSAVARGIRVALIHMPLAQHPQAKPAALAAICAAEIGQFPGAHAFFMRTTDWRDDSAWVAQPAFASIGNSEQYRSCRESQKAEQLLAVHRALVDSLHPRGTPTFIGPRGTLVGRVTLEALEALAQPSK